MLPNSTDTLEDDFAVSNNEYEELEEEDRELTANSITSDTMVDYRSKIIDTNMETTATNLQIITLLIVQDNFKSENGNKSEYRMFNDFPVF